MKLCVLILLLLTLSVAFAAQDVCVSASKTTLALHKMRLEMSPAEVQGVLGIKIKVKKTGERTFFQNFIKNPPPQTLPDARALYLRFYDGKLYQIEIFYENRAAWQTLESFTGSLSAQWNFPVSAWQIKKGRAAINCREFSLVADNILNPRIEITDETARAQVEANRKKEN